MYPRASTLTSVIEYVTDMFAVGGFPCLQLHSLMCFNTKHARPLELQAFRSTEVATSVAAFPTAARACAARTTSRSGGAGEGGLCRLHTYNHSLAAGPGV